MTVNIHLHKTHRQYTGGKKVVKVNGNAVGTCLAELIKKYPAIEGQLFEQKYRLKKNIEIYVNMESAYPDELGRQVRDGDDIYITLILTGG